MLKAALRLNVMKEIRSILICFIFLFSFSTPLRRIIDCCIYVNWKIKLDFHYYHNYYYYYYYYSLKSCHF